MDRRAFLKSSLSVTGAAAGLAWLPGCHAPASRGQNSIGLDHDRQTLRISLAEWSLHRTLHSGEMTNLDFPGWAREHGISAIEYVNSFFKDKAEDQAYLAELNGRCTEANVRALLIMVDGEGQLGHQESAQRRKAVENHFRWVTAAKTLGCHAIRVNAAGGGDSITAMYNAADGLRQLCEFGDEHDISIIVENHGGLSSNGAWLASVMEEVDHPRIGTLPDFGN
ncbi:MAG: sugar phosphate isomerase/epimerase, partial [Planctomycetes bacterium]|nr:sugar phosphate isomerase/epimerase [Planctomycetota bacterium]